MRDCTDNKSDVKLDLEPVIKKSGGSNSSHSYGCPSETFTEKTKNAMKKEMKINLCDTDGKVWEYKVWNKDPIYKSVFQPFVNAANLDIRVSITG